MWNKIKIEERKEDKDNNKRRIKNRRGLTETREEIIRKDKKIMKKTLS